MAFLAANLANLGDAVLGRLPICGQTIARYAGLSA
jgi:hypothetical protein